MMAAAIGSAHGLPRCERCGDVIGVYEPLVHVTGETARQTSRAAEPDVATASRVYHPECDQLAIEEK